MRNATRSSSPGFYRAPRSRSGARSFADIFSAQRLNILRALAKRESVEKLGKIVRTRTEHTLGHDGREPIEDTPQSSVAQVSDTPGTSELEIEITLPLGNTNFRSFNSAHYSSCIFHIEHRNLTQKHIHPPRRRNIGEHIIGLLK